jgi:hypothetical protein
MLVDLDSGHSLAHRRATVVTAERLGSMDNGKV